MEWEMELGHGADVGEISLLTSSAISSLPSMISQLEKAKPITNVIGRYVSNSEILLTTLAVNGRRSLNSLNRHYLKIAGKAVTTWC